MLEIRDVALRPGAPRFSHTFAPGEVCVVLGPNQSGKTNLCRLIAGLPTEAEGQVSIDGLSLQEVPVRRRPVAMVYQAFINYPNLTVAQNIASPLRAQGVALDEINLQVRELAAKTGIDTLLGRRPDELSGGQQQRLAIARALAKRARVLLLDEPLVNLDFKLREALEQELAQLLKDSDTVVIYTSSDPRDAFTLGNELVLLVDSTVQQVGKPLHVYRSPDSLQAMELLSDPGVNCFERGGQQCAVRPEHIDVVGSATPSAEVDRLDFTMQVTALETNGDESIVHGLVEQREWVVRCPGIVHTASGGALALSVRQADVAAF